MGMETDRPLAFLVECDFQLPNFANQRPPIKVIFNPGGDCRERCFCLKDMTV